ncbi:precorrin-6y C5,15-methyltransferase (decarboxylating) subunit CbiE [Aureimonas glaciei]|uniref:Precorrin-6Y C5,15-methyltransferase (Decarboxylating) n=1 Tax=Aureimonas glaciei TaxID=1776957 RepID=A0A917D6X1_9HYPH|nr:precorrin-6y C5,15-methyltransferase (decarboxylating) subunit CbiE [Aureimonas glaciei]GGD04676.1 precorrin-6Y C5,15-methyltransferase (decarboxylating) [Aureimonas glaciei]
MTGPRLTVIGIGDGGLATLTPEARAALDAAEVVFGGARHLAMLAERDDAASVGSAVSARATGRSATDAQRHVAWKSPFRDSLADIAAARSQRVAVLASGDPFWFGVAGTLSAVYGPDEMRVLPAPSSFQLAAARLGWPVESVECLTVHGRPLAAVQPAIQPGARLLVLSEGAATPAALAALLVGRGFAESRITVLEHLGGAAERVRATIAQNFDLPNIAALNLVAVDCIAAPDAALLPTVAGLPDEAFVHDGKMTKRVARALAIAALAPFPGAVLWDVGAGSGSVAVEFMRAARGARAVAFEPLAERRALIAANAEALGTPGITIVEGRAPESLAAVLGAPDAVFIGGGLSEDVFAPALARLKPGGRLVAHAVTLESERLLIDLHATHGGELLRLSVDRAEPVGPFRGWRPAMPVLHFAMAKPHAKSLGDAP